MTINRVKPAGWALNEKLTSAQQNAVDTNVTNALDKRAGQTDTLNSVVTIGSTGEIKFSSSAKATFQSGSVNVFQSGAGTTFDSGSTTSFNGICNFGATNISTFANGSAITFDTGSDLEIDGYCTFGSLSQTTYLIGSLTTFNTLSFVNFLGIRQYNGNGSHESTDSDTYKSGSLITHLSGSTDTYNSGSFVNFNGIANYSGLETYLNGSVKTHNSRSLIKHNSGSYDHYLAGSGMTNDGYGEFADLRLLGSSIITYDTPRTYTRSFIPCVDQNWYMAGHPDFVFRTSVVGGKAWIDLGDIGLPNGATITEMRAYYLPAGAHANLPGLLPRISLVTRQIGFTAIGVLSTKVDTFANLGAYESIGHEITKNMGAGTTLDYDVRDYWVVFEGEDGSDAEIGFELKYMTVVFEAPNMNDY